MNIQLEDTQKFQYVTKLGKEWFWSKVYYDPEQDRFLEERYHEEYLDTGTVCDGWFSIADQDLWAQLQKENNIAGVAAYLKIKGTEP